MRNRTRYERLGIEEVFWQDKKHWCMNGTKFRSDILPK